MPYQLDKSTLPHRKQLRVHELTHHPGLFMQKFIEYLTKEQFDKLGMEGTGDHFTWWVQLVEAQSCCNCLRVKL